MGGVLVSLAFVAALWLGSDDQASPSATAAVANRDLRAGDRLAATDLRWVAIDLPSGLDAPPVGPDDDVSKLVVLTPRSSGELIQASDLAPATSEADGREISFVVESQYAAGGRVQRGDWVDVLVTYGEGTTSSTTRVLSNIVVHEITDVDGGGLGGASNQAITVSVADGDDVLALANASRAGAVTLARTTGAPANPKGTQYQPPGSDGDAGEDVATPGTGS